MQEICIKKMKKLILSFCAAALLFSSCAHEFNQVFKVNDTKYQYEYAKELYAQRFGYGYERL